MFNTGDKSLDKLLLSMQIEKLRGSLKDYVKDSDKELERREDGYLN